MFRDNVWRATPVVGRQALQRHVAQLRHACPDVHYEVEQMGLQDDTHLFVLWTCHETQLESAAPDRPASHHASIFQGVDVLTFSPDRSKVRGARPHFSPPWCALSQGGGSRAARLVLGRAAQVVEVNQFRQPTAEEREEQLKMQHHLGVGSGPGPPGPGPLWCTLLVQRSRDVAAGRPREGAEEKPLLPALGAGEVSVRDQAGAPHVMRTPAAARRQPPHVLGPLDRGSSSTARTTTGDGQTAQQQHQQQHQRQRHRRATLWHESVGAPARHAGPESVAAAAAAGGSCSGGAFAVGACIVFCMLSAPFWPTWGPMAPPPQARSAMASEDELPPARLWPAAATAAAARRRRRLRATTTNSGGGGGGGGNMTVVFVVGRDQDPDGVASVFWEDALRAAQRDSGGTGAGGGSPSEDDPARFAHLN